MQSELADRNRLSDNDVGATEEAVFLIFDLDTNGNDRCLRAVSDKSHAVFDRGLGGIDLWIAMTLGEYRK